MLRSSVAAVSAATYVPIAVGAVVAGVGVIAYLLTYGPPPDAKDEIARWPERQQLALRLVTAMFLALAVLLLLVALVLGGPGFVLTAALLVIVAAGALLSFWVPKAKN